MKRHILISKFETCSGWSEPLPQLLRYYTPGCANNGEGRSLDSSPNPRQFGVEVENEVKDKLIVSLKDNYKEDTLTNRNSISNAWNYMFMTLDCCGVNPVVSTKNDFDSTYWCTDDGSCHGAVSNIPKTCCLNVDENTYTTAPTACHSSVHTGTYNTKVPGSAESRVLAIGRQIANVTINSTTSKVNKKPNSVKDDAYLSSLTTVNVFHNLSLK
uniref:Uncharacterized protein n=1 Tax=Magallana gigas TaxID=29159 RepID=K1QA03_MAGGI